MQLSEFTYFLHKAQAVPGVSVQNCQLGLDLYRNFVHNDFAPGVAFTAQVKDGENLHNVWVYFAKYNGQDVIGFKCGDTFMENHIEGQRLFRVDLCARAAAGLPNQAEVAGKLNRLIGVAPKSSQCDFWGNWRRNKEACPHVNAVLVHLREQLPDFVNQLKQAYNDAYPVLPLAA